MKRVLHKKKWLKEKQTAAATRRVESAAAKEARKTSMLENDRYGAVDAPEISHRKLKHLNRLKAEKNRPVYEPPPKIKLKPQRRNLDNIVTDDECEE